MPSSKFPETADSASNKGPMDIADEIEEMDDFVLISPGDYPEASAPSSTAAKDVWTEIIKITRTENSLFEKGEKHVTAVETCRYHLRPTECRKTCNSTFKCDACLSLIAGLETLANCAWEWSNDSKPFQDNISNIMHCLHRLPFHFQEGLYSVIEAVMDHEENWPTADRENYELWGFKISAALWLLRLGVHGLAWALEEGKEWRLVLAETERSWYEGLVVADEYEEAVEETKRFTTAFRKWGASVDAERRARSSLVHH